MTHHWAPPLAEKSSDARMCSSKLGLMSSCLAELKAYKYLQDHPAVILLYASHLGFLVAEVEDPNPHAGLKWALCRRQLGTCSHQPHHPVLAGAAAPGLPVQVALHASPLGRVHDHCRGCAWPPPCQTQPSGSLQAMTRVYLYQPCWPSGPSCWLKRGCSPGLAQLQVLPTEAHARGVNCILVLY